jgi:hypothetical protein
LTLRQATSIPEVPATTLAVEAGTGSMTLRVRVPGWATTAAATLNGRPQSLPSKTSLADSPEQAARPAVIEVTRVWRPGDELVISFGMGLALGRAPDNPRVAALTYGPVVLAALTGDAERMPALDVSSIRQVSASPLAFEALGSFGTPGDARLISLIPVCDVVHQRYTTYWQIQ